MNTESLSRPKTSNPLLNQPVKYLAMTRYRTMNASGGNVLVLVARLVELVCKVRSGVVMRVANRFGFTSKPMTLFLTCQRCLAPVDVLWVTSSGL
jgi:hypothetical protein